MDPERDETDQAEDQDSPAEQGVADGAPRAPLGLAAALLLFFVLLFPAPSLGQLLSFASALLFFGTSLSPSAIPASHSRPERLGDLVGKLTLILESVSREGELEETAGQGEKGLAREGPARRRRHPDAPVLLFR
jgi:hypothetical protein